MSTINYPSQTQRIVQEIDRLIAEMMVLRDQVSALSESPARTSCSVREAEYFGMWSDRDDMQGLSSREWLERSRAQQWKHR
jgi:hypothetical protein